MPDTFVPRGRYFEEFQVGDVVVSAGRTITEADIVAFAGLSGDYTQIHTDAEFSRQGMFGQRVAHGLLLLSIASGLTARLGLIEGTALAFRELTWKFSLPLFIGDSIGFALGSAREDDFLLGQPSLIAVINDSCLYPSLRPLIFADAICVLSG